MDNDKPMQPPTESDKPYVRERQKMVARQLADRDIVDQRVLSAMAKVERHRFVPPEFTHEAYADNPVSIGYGQTISQPYIVALMTQLVRPQPTDRALEIGTGCGYQTAILAELVNEVYSIEIVEPLATEAKQRLADLGCLNVHVRVGDGFQGWSEHAPYDVMIVAAAPERIPPPLFEQLAYGGRLVIPLGGYTQELMLLEKQLDGQLRETRVAGVRFVPMTGEAQRRKD